MQNLDTALSKLQLFILAFLASILVLGLGISRFLVDTAVEPKMDFQPRLFAFDAPIQAIPLAQFVLNPQRIQIPSQGIDVSVQKGGVVNGEWVLSAQSAYFMPKELILDDNLNAIIYAHKRVGLFLNLYKVNVGDQILITDESGRTYTYQVVKTLVSDPKNLDNLKADGVNFITLITCDGVFDKERLVVKAALIS